MTKNIFQIGRVYHSPGHSTKFKCVARRKDRIWFKAQNAGGNVCELIIKSGLNTNQETVMPFGEWPGDPVYISNNFTKAKS